MEVEVHQRTTADDSAVLIFDELEYEPFTENRWRPAAKEKITRLALPATPQFACIA
jgi:hypothetical protein